MKQKQVFKVSAHLMGNQFEISAVSENEDWASERINAGINEIKRIEKLLTTFDDSSETNLINRNAGIEAVKVSEETFSLIERSIRISNITQGAFDITYGSIDKSLWNFDTTMKSLPDEENAKNIPAVKKIKELAKKIVNDKENAQFFIIGKDNKIEQSYTLKQAIRKIRNQLIRDQLKIKIKHVFKKVENFFKRYILFK